MIQKIINYIYKDYKTYNNGNKLFRTKNGIGWIETSENELEGIYNLLLKD